MIPVFIGLAMAIAVITFVEHKKYQMLKHASERLQLESHEAVKEDLLSKLQDAQSENEELSLLLLEKVEDIITPEMMEAYIKEKAKSFHHDWVDAGQADFNSEKFTDTVLIKSCSQCHARKYDWDIGHGYILFPQQPIGVYIDGKKIQNGQFCPAKIPANLKIVFPDDSIETQSQPKSRKTKKKNI